MCETEVARRGRSVDTLCCRRSAGRGWRARAAYTTSVSPPRARG